MKQEQPQHQDVYVTFWKSDFVGENYNQLIDILRQHAIKGKGYWFDVKTNMITAMLPEQDYEWIMNHVANYGDENINK